MAGVPLLLVAESEVGTESWDGAGARERLQHVCVQERLRWFSDDELRVRWVVEGKEWGSLVGTSICRGIILVYR
jgi:hypothetical protein